VRLAEKLSLALRLRHEPPLLHGRWAAAGPFSATFAVTNRCNLRCSYCNCPFIDPTNLDLPRIAVLFDRLREMGIRRLDSPAASR